MFFTVYVLINKDRRLYIGFTTDLKKRLREHNHQENKSTAPHAPWSLIYFEGHSNEKDARRRERYLKTSQGAWAVKRMLRERLQTD